jgi:large subunit ribosomal protein L10
VKITSKDNPSVLGGTWIFAWQVAGQRFLIFRQKGGEFPLAFIKDEKTKIMSQYQEWLSKSQAVFLLEFSKMTMKEVDTLRAKAREAGGEMHVVKNTLFSLVMDQLGISGKEYLTKTTMVGFAFNDAPALAKVMIDSTKGEVFKVKGGFLAKNGISADDIKALSTLPPLPVVRAQFLGLLSTPATRLVRTIAEPARGIASVVRAYSEKDNAPAAEAVA